MQRQNPYRPHEIWRYAKVWWRLRQLKRYNEASKILKIYWYPTFWISPFLVLVLYLTVWTPSLSISKITPEPAQQADSGIQADIVESKHVFMGMPLVVNYPNKISILERQAYMVGYDEIRKNPAWVGFYLPNGDAGKAPKPGRVGKRVFCLPTIQGLTTAKFLRLKGGLPGYILKNGFHDLSINTTTS